MYTPDTLTLYRCVFVDYSQFKPDPKGAADVYRGLLIRPSNTPTDLIH